MLDQQKLVNELISRSTKVKETAAKYDKEINCRDIANGYLNQARVYDEIVSDINKGKFNLKDPKK